MTRRQGSTLRFTHMIVYRALAIFAATLLLSSPSASTEKSNPSVYIGFQKGKIVFTAHNAPMKAIMKRFNETFNVIISGLEERANEKVTYSARAASVSDLLKGFFQHLAVKNYALEYNSEQLHHVSVLPEAKGKSEVPAIAESKQAASDEAATKVTTTEVQTVVIGSPAMEAGIMVGDLIIQYDGVKIHRASQLVRESKKKTPDETVELIGKRDGQTVRFTLKGGYIGIRIRTVEVLPADIEVR